MRLELYAPRASAVHALHPATKLALLVAALVAPFLTTDVATQALSLVAALAAAAAGRVLREVLAPWRLLLFLFLVTYLLWGVSGFRELTAELDHAGPATAVVRFLAGPSMTAALAYALRVTGIFIFGLAFLATTRIEETVQGLEIVGVPFRLAFALGLAFRLVPLFLGAAASITEAQRARGLDLERGSARERLAKYVPILVPIFMTSLRDADQMAMALEARGFASGARRTRFRRYRFGLEDAIALALGAGYVALFAAFRSGALSLVPRAL
jgi:energy-coupling factor transport system permease protein